MSGVRSKGRSISGQQGRRQFKELHMDMCLEFRTPLRRIQQAGKVCLNDVTSYFPPGTVTMTFSGSDVLRSWQEFAYPNMERLLEFCFMSSSECMTLFHLIYCNTVKMVCTCLKFILWMIKDILIFTFCGRM